MSITHDALRSKSDIARLEERGLVIIRRRVELAYHEYQAGQLKEQGKTIQSGLERVKAKASKALLNLAGMWI